MPTCGHKFHKIEITFRFEIDKFSQDWNIFVTEESFEAGLSRLERQVALKQAKARGFFTYTDLTVACDGALAAELLRALTAACLTLLATLLTSALVVSHAWLPALRLIASRSTDLAAPDAFVPPAAPHTFVNNATVELTIDALADSLVAPERLECCGAWSRRRRGEPARAGSWGSWGSWGSRARALTWLYWSTLASPVQRWLERVAQYAELTTTTIISASTLSDDRCYDNAGLKRKSPQRCAHWLNLSKLSALLVTVSDR